MSQLLEISDPNFVCGSDDIPFEKTGILGDRAALYLDHLNPLDTSVQRMVRIQFRKARAR